MRYSYDELGNLISLTYPGGEIVRYSYDKLGNIQTVTDSDGNNNLHRHHKRRTRNRQRKRDPTNAQSLNRFSYVHGNPISYTDPFSLFPEGVDYWLKHGHGILDLAGFIPGIGDVADFINALW